MEKVMPLIIESFFWNHFSLFHWNNSANFIYSMVCVVGRG